MAYTYTAIVQYQDSDGRFANLTGAATVTAYDLAGNSIAGPTITNIATGVYLVSVTQTDLEDVVFRVVPHADDQADFADVAVMQEKIYHVADNIFDICSLAAINLVESVSEGEIIQIRGNSWDFDIEDLTLDANKQQFAIKYTHRNAALNQSAPAWTSTSPDADALVLIDSYTGLLYLNGALASDPTLGSLSYAGSTLTVTLSPAATQLLAPGTYIFGIQSVTALGVVSEIYGGTFTITADVVRSVS